MKELPSLLLKLRNDPAALELANEHHLNGLLFYHYKDLFPEAIFKTEWKRQWQYNLTLKLEMTRLGERFLSRGLNSPTILKGVALFATLYPDLGSRFVSDCDLLVDPSEFSHVISILEEDGYVCSQVKTWKANHFKKEFSKIVEEQEINIELHSQLFYHAQIPLNFVSSAIPGFRQLDKDDMVLHLAGHLAFQHTYLKLYWLFDLYFYFSRYSDELNWEELFKRAQAQKVKQSLVSVLSVLENEFQLTFPVTQKKWNGPGAEFLLRPQSSRINFYLLKHRLKDHWLEAFCYDCGWLAFQIKQKIFVTKRDSLC